MDRSTARGLALIVIAAAAGVGWWASNDDDTLRDPGSTTIGAAGPGAARLGHETDRRHVIVESDTDSEPVVASGRLVVTVLTAANGDPLPGAQVEARPFRDEILQPATPASARGQTNANGRVSLRLSGGDYWIRATFDDRSSTTPIVAVTESGPTHIDLVVGAALAVDGRVLTPEGEPAADAILHIDALDSEGGYDRVFGRADGDGRFSVPSVPLHQLDRLTISVDHGGRPRNGFSFTRAELEANQHLVLRMHATRVTGRCLDEGGRPVVDVAVQATDGRKPVAFTDSDGRFDIEVAEREPSALKMSSQTHAARRVTLPQPDAANTVALGDVRLDVGAPLRGHVSGPDARPRVGAYLTLRSAELDDVVGVAVSAADGTFAFEHVGPGPHELTALRTMRSWPDFQLAVRVEDLRAGAPPVSVELPDPIRVTMVFADDVGTPVVPRRIHLVVRPSGDAGTMHDTHAMNYQFHRAAFEVARPGPYDVTVAIAGFEPRTRSALRITTEGPNTFDFRLTPKR